MKKKTKHLPFFYELPQTFPSSRSISEIMMEWLKLPPSGSPKEFEGDLSFLGFSGVLLNIFSLFLLLFLSTPSQCSVTFARHLELLQISIL